MIGICPLHVKHLSVPSRKPNGAGAVDNKAKTGPAARKPTQTKPASARPNGKIMFMSS